MSDTILSAESISFTKEEEVNIAIDGKSKKTAIKPSITAKTESEILQKIQSHCDTWNQISLAYNICIIIFGISAISTSVLVSIYTGQEELVSVAALKILACASTISLSILTAFNLVSNASNARMAWRSLNAAMMMYKAGSISIQELIEQYQKGENQLGSLGFNYGTNNDKPATYSNDIKDKIEDQNELKESETAAKNKLSNDSQQRELINNNQRDEKDPT